MIESLLARYPAYSNTCSLLRELQPESYSLLDQGNVIVLHFTEPKGSLQLTIEELIAMNDPHFLSFYLSNRTLNKKDILIAIKAEFGKQIWQAGAHGFME